MNNKDSHHKICRFVEGVSPKKQLEKIKKFFDIKTREREIALLEEETIKPLFWQDQFKAQQILKKISLLKKSLLRWQNLVKKIEDLKESAKEEEIEKIKKEIQDFESLTFLTGEYDRLPAILSCHSGTGGTDACDWNEMLMRMYLRFCEKKDWSVKIINISSAKEAGVKSATLLIEGESAYGFLKGEAGVHRLIRISPFDAEKMRHTSFALVEVLPIIEEEEIQIKDEDLKIETYLASGHGGQSVQKTETAVRIRHSPTGITVSCQSERSQYQNKKEALRVLKAKLAILSQTKKEEEKNQIRGEFREASWANQIRSYFLHPYKLIKDHRTGYETSQAERVLDGDLDELIESYLKKSKIKDKK